MKENEKNCNFGGGKGTMKLNLFKGQGQGRERWYKTLLEIPKEGGVGCEATWKKMKGREIRNIHCIIGSFEEE